MATVIASLMAGTVQGAESVVPAQAAAPTVHLELSYHTMNIDSDGVQRDARYEKRMHRAGNTVWVERLQPQALKDSHAHDHGEHENGNTHAGHAHTQAEQSPLLVKRLDDGQVSVQSVVESMKMLIDVERAHQGNVGYNGSWEATYWVIPPSSLELLEPVGQPRDGVQLYQRMADESLTEVAWDIEKQYPRRVSKRGAHGISSYEMIAKEVQAPQALPWTQLQDYAQGDYSDLLD